MSTFLTIPACRRNGNFRLGVIQLTEPCSRPAYLLPAEMFGWKRARAPAPCFAFATATFPRRLSLRTAGGCHAACNGWTQRSTYIRVLATLDPIPIVLAKDR